MNVKLMNRFFATGALALMAAVPVSQAADVTNQFAVTVTLTSRCEVQNDSTQTLDFGTYSAFQDNSITPTSINLQFNCTRGFAPTSVAFDTTNGTSDGYGVIAGLNYKLAVAAPSSTAGNAATAASGGLGTADLVNYVVSGEMFAEQAGTDANNLTANGAATQNRTLTISY